MSILQIKTENPNLSYLLIKNPQTQIDTNKPFKKSTKSLHCLGWYPNPQKPLDFVLYSKKIINPKDKDFEYLDYTSQSSPENILILIQELCRNIFKTTNDQYDTYPVTLTFNVQGKYNLDGIIGKVENFENVKNFHKVTINSKTLHEGINLVALYCYVQYIFSHDFYFVDEQYEKYLNLLVQYTKDYNLLNRFLSVVNSLEKHKKYSEIVMNATSYVINFGNNSEQRLNTILTYFRESITDPSKVLLDIGSGEGIYTKYLSKDFNKIISIEKDPEVFIELEWTAKKKELKNVELHNSCIFDYLDSNESTIFDAVLCTEVLEHIPKDQATKLMKKLVDKKIKDIVITVPNKDFNVHYGMTEDQVRIEDHCWEPTYNEFNEFISEIQNSNYNVTVYPLGNKVAGTTCSSTIMAHFKLKHQEI